MPLIHRVLAFVWAGILIVTLSACQTTQNDAGRTQLDRNEVSELFIGTPWHGPSGAFLFRTSGTYTYKDFESATPRGTWEYEMDADGTLEGQTTDYTFYRRSDGGYEYFHSRTGEFYPATPNQPPFL